MKGGKVIICLFGIILGIIVGSGIEWWLYAQNISKEISGGRKKTDIVVRAAEYWCTEEIRSHVEPKTISRHTGVKTTGGRKSFTIVVSGNFPSAGNFPISKSIVSKKLKGYADYMRGHCDVLVTTFITLSQKNRMEIKIKVEDL